MKLNLTIGCFLLYAVILLTGCSGKKEKPEVNSAPETSQAAPVMIGTETSLLLKDLEENGDYVNSKEFPSLIKASLVFENLGKNMLVVDIRPASSFAKGHIKSAVNKKFEDLPGYFESGIKAFSYDKIIIVSDDGQVASYTTCLLRLMGYGNVYALRWGMGGWNKEYAGESWLKGVSGKYEANLDTSVVNMPQAVAMPELNTGKTTGQEIGDARFKEVFSKGTGDVMISPDEVFAHPEQYYTINYERKDKYEDGHIPGAVRYKPDATLGIVSEMATIPSDKTIVVYCGTGHNSAFVSAYLRLFGYNAKTLTYGNNGFMHDKMNREKEALSWLPFTVADTHDYPVVK
jgi:rhodanese-related sulfurtransferase